MQQTALKPGHRFGDTTLETLLQARPGLSIWRGSKQDGAPVVVKVLAACDRSMLRALQRAFRQTRGLRLAGVTSPLALHTDSEPVYVVRPWVQGVPLLDAVREPPSQTRVERCLELGAKLFGRLAALHREGMVHGQLGSENVWVTAEDDVVLTDLGSSIRRVLPGADSRPGQLPPSAPEEIAGWAPRASTDVLAAGALLYAALLPRLSDGTEHTLPWGSAARQAAPGLALRLPQVPRRLCRLLARTQALDPADRPSAAELAQRLSDPQMPSEPAPLPPCPARVDQSDDFDTAAAHLAEAGTRLLLLHGPAGSGRRRLADSLCRTRLRSGRPTLRITARRDELGTLIVGTLRRLIGTDQHAARRQRLLRDMAAPLGTLWPHLVPGNARQSGPHDANQILDAAITVASRASVDRPAVWVMEHIEDADPLSLRWLRRLASAEGVDLEVIGILDERWQPDELRRFRTSLDGHPAVRSLRLRDVSARSAMLMTGLLTRAMPEARQPHVDDEGPSVSPARITETAHAALAQWRGETEPQPDVGATVFAIEQALPIDALKALQLDPQQLMDTGIAVPSRPGWVAAAHEGIVELGRRGLHRRDKLAARLLDVLEKLEVSQELQARVGMHVADPKRAVAARAAIAAWRDDRPTDARRWLQVAERLRRDPQCASYLAIRPELARVRAELAHSGPHAAARPRLLQQAERRARTPSEQADLSAARGLVSLHSGLADAAVKTWRAGASDPDASPMARSRCAALLFDHTLQSGQIVIAGQAVHVLQQICRETEATVAMRRGTELRAARFALAQGEPGAAMHRLKEWLVSRPGHDTQVELVRAEAALQSGRTTFARKAVDRMLDKDPQNTEAIEFHALLVLDAGDTRAAIRAQRRLQHLDPQSAWQLPLRMRVTVAQGDKALLQPLLAVTAPTRRPDHRAAWMTATLDVLRIVHAPEIRLARVEEAQRSAASSPFADLHIALAWHLLDGANNTGAAARANTAEDLARHLSDPGRTLRARLLHAAATGVSSGAWSYLVERARQVEWLPLLADALELSVHVARRNQSKADASAAIRELSNLALTGPDHGLAARATRVAKG